MSMDKSIAAGKEHRKPYSGSKSIDPSCRCHGGCDWCRDGRMHKYNKRLRAAADRVKIYIDETI